MASKAAQAPGHGARVRANVTLPDESTFQVF